MDAMTPNPALAHIVGLIGTWKGRGRGIYPTIRDFDYVDEWEFRDIGKPFLLFTERTWIGEN
nr:FABP family protein [Actinomycetales bacterium]